MSAPSSARRLLERGHAIELFVELRGLDTPMNPIQKRRRIPRAQKQSHPAAWWKGLPIAPVFGPLPLLVGGIAKRARHEPAGVHPLAQEVDRLALPGAVDAGEHDNDRTPSLRAQVALHLEQLGAQPWYSCLVLLFRDDTPELGSFKHEFPPLS